MSGHCHGCGTYHEEDDDRLCGRCVEDLDALRKGFPAPETALKLEIERLSAMVYETGPGEFSPDGWTWKQAFQAEKKRREEAEAAIETLHEKYAQERISRSRQTLSDNTKMENQ